MKRIGADHIGFTEIGGAGEIVYRVVRFRAYYPDYDHDDVQVVQPSISPAFEPVEGEDYQLNGQELLYNLCNLYHELNDSCCVISAADKISWWCKENIQPYNFKMLSALMDDDDPVMLWELLQKEALFYVKDFVHDLCNLGMTMDFYTAFTQARYSKNPQFARNLYYEGKLADSMPFMEKYRRYEDDKEYLRHINDDYEELTDILLGLFPEFKLSLQKDRRTGKIGMYADIDSVFDICWYSFSRMVADVAPPMDTDEDSYYLYSSASYICCLVCGRYVKRNEPKQKYCDGPDCQAARKRMNSKDCYYRKKVKE